MMSKQVLISLVNYSWQWTLLAGLIWLVSKRLKNVQTISHHLWILTLIGLPVLFILNLFVPTLSISTFPSLGSHPELAAIKPLGPLMAVVFTLWLSKKPH